MSQNEVLGAVRRASILEARYLAISPADTHLEHAQQHLRILLDVWLGMLDEPQRSFFGKHGNGLHQNLRKRTRVIELK
jgi:hypothetical protein